MRPSRRTRKTVRPMLNHIVLMGRLVRDPELRRTQSGVAVASFRLAVDRDFANQQTGEREADFIDIVAWRSTGEFVSKYFAKGRMAVVAGRLQMRNWTDNNGQKRTNAEIVADNIYFGDSNRADNNQRTGKSYAAPTAPNGSAQAGDPVKADFSMLEEDDSELPF